MGCYLTTEAFDTVLMKLKDNFRIFAPKRHIAGGHFSDTDIIRYGEIETSSDIELDEKSAQSFKEVLLPIMQTLFYFTEDEIKESDAPAKAALVFLRSCDLHAVQRLDEIYLRNGPEDHYYSRVRDRVRFALIGCETAFDTCFCVDMGTNRSENYDFSIDRTTSGFSIDCRNTELEPLFNSAAESKAEVSPSYVTQTRNRVRLPDKLNADVGFSEMWDEYDTRCINCGRCNFVCPTCTCYTMQDLFYTDNGRAGERRRVWASCMTDGFTDVAGGGGYRRKNGQRMRFKVLHKVLDYRQRFGHNMCVGCGRCDDVCPEYISFSNILNKLGEAMEEVTVDAGK